MKIRILFYSFFILLFLLIQTTVLNYAAIYGVVPNLLIVFVLLTALTRGHVEGGVVGFFAGLASDMSFGGLLGLNALLGLFLGLLAGSFHRRLFRENLLVVVILTFVYSFLYEWIRYLLNTALSGNLELWTPITSVILPEAAYNCLAAALMYWLLVKADKRFEQSENAQRKY